MYNYLESLRHIAWMLNPIMPTIATNIMTQLGIPDEFKKSWNDAKRWGGLAPGTRIAKGELLFPRLNA